MEMALDGAALHFRQRFQQAEDTCAILTQQLHQVSQERDALQQEITQLKEQLANRETEQLELSLTE